SERVSIRDNVGFLLLPLWVHLICIGYFSLRFIFLEDDREGIGGREGEGNGGEVYKKVKSF
ncbi:hypothetical protein Golob_022992, partial [Gossypium lobatum]|nr:hypothetical protein [Gossypium lobatum]